MRWRRRGNYEGSAPDTHRVAVQCHIQSSPIPHILAGRAGCGWNHEDREGGPVDRILQSLGQIPHELTLITDRISSQEFQSSLQKQRETVSKRLLLAEKGLSLLKGNESDHPGHLGGGLGGAVFVLTLVILASYLSLPVSP